MDFEVIQPRWQESGDYWFDLLDSLPRDQLSSCLQMPNTGEKLSDDAAMFLAYASALRGVGNVSPNPLVGAVVLAADGGFLAAGCHLKVGGAHAEVHALKRAASVQDLKGCQIFVTLEPCAHEGRTPSCAKLIAQTGISRIVFGLTDPNPKVNGQGAKILMDAGKKVDWSQPWSTRCAWLARVFIHNQQKQEIYTALKVASTPSGVIAGVHSSRLWITGERARQMGHFLRLEYDAVVVGIKTALMDDPLLSVRHPTVSGRTPLRIILDASGALIADPRPLRMFKDSPERTLVVVSDHQDCTFLKNLYGIDAIALAVDQNKHFAWSDIKRDLWARGVRSLLIEGGAGLYQTALDSRSVDVVHWFVAPERGLEGLKWPMITEALDSYNHGCGVPLGDDKLIERSLGLEV